MKKFPKIKSISDPEVEVFVNDDDRLYVLEKLDGANFRWKLHNSEQIIAGSRNVEFKQHNDPLPIDETNKQFRHTIKYLQQTINFNALQDIIDKYGELIFFGESLHTHTINYEVWNGKHPGIENATPNYVGFDIWSVEQGDWLSHELVESIHEQINLETVPVLFETTVSEITDEELQIPNSTFRTPNPDAEDEFNRQALAEGLVVKNDTLGNRAKKVAEYMQEVQQHGTPDDDESIEDLKHRKRNAKKFVNTFVTEQRVLKHAHKLVDEGNYTELEMPIMKDLPQAVLTDIFIEEGWNILNHEYGIEFTEDSKADIRQLTSDKCARILKEELHSP